jgi:hypothetical protein
VNSTSPRRRPGTPNKLNAVDEDLSEPFFDDLPADDWAA